ncbi:hypothetical protein CcaverHIS002_0403000 [Cutaneotrichosporon cavernicola]|uniref:Mitochondrial import inner membrane translocase subunit TIM22 n=1 Tax=Cutaneotrichosporon cavernicola TaxID=279322 RepID=A0AA48L3U8_9TREE|nr:uncharacterized protein CcaverHIS019_0402960 [Cutaneotrichosporon cavernicola]BEI83696.1 hypothetical protein CcaverHIS002_0403000 [Cutaneotrichosporon cavernicola]BEI91476.1 hypothetical protein CcaverHIS019_0402960 [Cutaneotrichosporon cavernicola]BEI99251.1 hypothetical protein CcaverHIS631_0402940 [Cutaneotrichosporon cavernicola]BEJ07028.1 hypothetical protein CcaverHIS641_0402970 [Cutaneotrichosporon cavernicola]
MAQPGNPWLAPIYLPGSEPYPPGTTEEEKEGYRQMQRWTKVGGDFMHYCPTKVAMAGGMGFALGGFVSLMGATFALDDPLSRANQQLTTGGKTMAVVKDMGRNMLSQGRGFAKVGALYSGYECVIEGYRAKNDHWNGIAGGFCAGATLARKSGPWGCLLGGLGFAAFSAVIDLYMRKVPTEEP